MSDVTAKFTVNPRKAIETEFRIDATILDHDKLYNRDLPDQHPMSAITGLEEALDEKQDILTSANAGTGISIEIVGGVVKINNTQNSAEWGQIDGDINQQTDLKTALDNKQDKLTQIQLDAVNSGATTANIAKISTNETAINNHISNTSNPHSVTKAQVGLGNVDNTSDLNKPISTATQTALNGKQATLVSGTNIKTINNQSLLGSGNITIGGAVDSVNGQTGAVVLTASDVGALPDSTVIPTEATVSGWGFTKNVGTVTSVNNTSPDGSGNVTLSIPAAQVNSDWNANSGVAEILNKPTLGTMAAESASDYTPTSSLATVATTGLYSDLSGTPTIPTVNDSTITLTQGGVTKGSFTLNQASGATIDFDAGGGSSYTAGTGIDITNNTITAKIATSVSASSDNTQSVGAKLFYDTCGDIESLINAL